MIQVEKRCKACGKIHMFDFETQQSEFAMFKVCGEECAAALKAREDAEAEKERNETENFKKAYDVAITKIITSCNKREKELEEALELPEKRAEVRNGRFVKNESERGEFRALKNAGEGYVPRTEVLDAAIAGKKKGYNFEKIAAESGFKKPELELAAQYAVRVTKQLKEHEFYFVNRGGLDAREERLVDALIKGGKTYAEIIVATGASKKFITDRKIALGLK